MGQAVPEVRAANCLGNRTKTESERWGNEKFMSARLPYVYTWKRTAMRVLDRKGQACKVLARGKMNSCMIEFADGFRTVTSRNALRKAKP